MTGCLIMKLSKMVATALGGTLTLLQIAHLKGYIKTRHHVDWNKMAKYSNTTTDKLEKKHRHKSNSGFEKFQDCVVKTFMFRGNLKQAFPRHRLFLSQKYIVNNSNCVLDKFFTSCIQFKAAF
jgi:hypothetical protein